MNATVRLWLRRGDEPVWRDRLVRSPGRLGVRSTLPGSAPAMPERARRGL